MTSHDLPTLPPPSPDAPATSSAAPPSRPSRSHSRKGPGRIVLIASIAVVALAGVRFATSRHAGAETGGAEGGRLPVAAVEKVGREDLAQTLTVAAEFRPYQQVSLHAKVAGYLQAIWVDVGDHVREGQAIAQLDVPEMHNELEKATAALHASEQEVARADAAYAEAHLAYTRLREVATAHPKLVAQQEVDAAVAKDAVTAAAAAAVKQKVEECTAEVSKVKAMISYTTIIAPFDGVVTKRLVDPGALIQTGTSANTQPLVELAQDKRLRLSFPVPESSVPLVKIGAAVRVKVGALGEKFEATVSRFSGKVDRSTRTMMTEVDVDNAEDHFKPGMIAEVGLVVRESKGAIAVPVQAITVGEKPTVLVVGPNDTVEKRAVKLGLETPSKTEVTEGVNPGDLVLVGARTGIQPGERVTPKLIATAE